jgi:hypothetical protein
VVEREEEDASSMPVRNPLAKLSPCSAEARCPGCCCCCCCCCRRDASMLCRNRSEFDIMEDEDEEDEEADA